MASVTIWTVCGSFGSFRLPQVMGGYFKFIRKSWESHGKSETVFPRPPVARNGIQQWKAPPGRFQNRLALTGSSCLLITPTPLVIQLCLS